MRKKSNLVFVVILVLSIIVSCTKGEQLSQGKLTVRIVDAITGREIENSNFKFIITEIDKEFSLSKENSIISIPYKKRPRENEYPSGYTTLTYVQGYYPRIDYNFKIGGIEDAELLIELTPLGELQNSSFTEVFHESSEVEMVEFFNYYNISELN